MCKFLMYNYQLSEYLVMANAGFGMAKYIMYWHGVSVDLDVFGISLSCLPWKNNLSFYILWLHRIRWKKMRKHNVVDNYK